RQVVPPVNDEHAQLRIGGHRGAQVRHRARAQRVTVPLAVDLVAERVVPPLDRPADDARHEIHNRGGRWRDDALEQRIVGALVRRERVQIVIRPARCFTRFSSRKRPSSATCSRADDRLWYWTHDATKTGFQARSVVGGVFLKLLYDEAVWKKWRTAPNSAAAQ